MSVTWRRSKIEPARQHLSIAMQCRLLSISRSSYYYTPVPETEETLALMTVIDETFMECPWYGSRQMARHLRRLGHAIGRRRVRRLMATMGLAAIYQRPRTSDPHPEHRIYPYLLRNLEITRPNQVWCVDVTYLPMRRGFLYLVAIMALRQAQEGEPQGAGLAAIEHHGRGLLRRGSGGCAGPFRQARDL